jgi:hypothetical protein
VVTLWGQASPETTAMNRVMDSSQRRNVDCAIVTLNLPAPARVLLIGQVSAQGDDGADGMNGYCELVSNAGTIVPGSKFLIASTDDIETFGMTAVTGVQATGSHDYGVDCNEMSASSHATHYREVGLSAVALSAD